MTLLTLSARLLKCDNVKLSTPDEIVTFAIQLEVRAEGRWREMLRYDCSHGFAHRDRYNLKGEQIKEALFGSYEEILTLADEDIKRAWREYKKRFLEGGYP